MEGWVGGGGWGGGVGWMSAILSGAVCSVAPKLFNIIFVPAPIFPKIFPFARSGRYSQACSWIGERLLKQEIVLWLVLYCYSFQNTSD